ncbi:MAG: hypothetical protein IKW37_01265 [Bacteroidaceae bacterium]|nr:hypothetical protein [Bacteroidaceae bacterium]
MDNLALARHHAWFHHYDSDGFITIAKKDKLSGVFKQYHYDTPEKLAENLSDWIGDDVFFSQNTFYKPARRIENIRQLRSLYIDLDFYLFNYDPSWVIGKLEHEFFGQSIPEPNIIIFSGQGIVLIWLIEPVPYKALPLWQAVQKYMLQELESLGGDPKAVDAARIFRIAGSRNTKNGAYVRTEYRHDYRYDLHQIQADYLPELKPKKQSTKSRKKKIVQLFNIYSLHFARIRDINKLIELRNGCMPNMRETTCFLYRYWMCCYLEDKGEALKATLELNDEFDRPLSRREVERATKSAEKAWEARSNKEADKIAKEKGYPGAGYNISNSKLIEWLDITQEEMEHLSTIINTKEKNRRRRVKYQEQDGKMSRSSYLQEEKKKTMSNLEKLKELIDNSPQLSNRKLAAELGISEAYVRKLKLQL